MSICAICSRIQFSDRNPQPYNSDRLICSIKITHSWYIFHRLICAIKMNHSWYKFSKIMPHFISIEMYNIGGYNHSKASLSCSSYCLHLIVWTHIGVPLLIASMHVKNREYALFTCLGWYWKCHEISREVTHFKLRHILQKRCRFIDLIHTKYF